MFLFKFQVDRWERSSDLAILRLFRRRRQREIGEGRVEETQEEAQQVGDECESVSKSGKYISNLDCDNTFPNDLAPNGIPFGAQSIVIL